LTPGDDGAGSADFKNRISPPAIAGLAGDFKWAWPDFPATEFEARAIGGLSGLEMKGRVVQVADALAAALPDDFTQAAAIVAKALERPGFDGWIVYPVDDYVARYGISHPEVALQLMAGLTSRWSCEFAIRPFIERHPRITFDYFDRWIVSDDEHLRRLVSEGSRPRLPWGSRLRAFIEDPTPTISLLDRLVDDPSPYVRKSVANHLNDISKDHPELVIQTASGWLESDPVGDSGRRDWIVSHGLRSLIKAGHPEALRLLGYDPEAEISLLGFRVTPEQIEAGEAITIEFSLLAEQPAPVMVDYAIHHAGASGMRSAKVFKLKKATLEAMVETDFRREHRIREVSVRRIHPGPHLVTLQVNGKVRASSTIQVTVGGPPD
jgi:3-methyladenine DNA glycosylase AlkC